MGNYSQHPHLTALYAHGTIVPHRLTKHHLIISDFHEKIAMRKITMQLNICKKHPIVEMLFVIVEAQQLLIVLKSEQEALVLRSLKRLLI